MRTIKFKGTTPRGAVVYGDLTHSGDLVFVNDYRVLPESVRQLCGYDMCGDEVYEGDIVVAHGRNYEVRLSSIYGVFKNLKSCIKKM